MVDLIHDVLVNLKDGSQIETTLTDEEAFENIKNGITIIIGVFSGNFILSTGASFPFTNLTSNTLSTVQNEDSDLRIEIISGSTKVMGITDIHEFEKLEDFVPPVEPPETEPPEPQPDTTVNSMMVSQSVGAFELKDNRIKGEVLFIANGSFNPFYYGKSISSFVQIKNIRNDVLVIKENPITFTEVQRDERITIDESAFNSNPVIIEFFVWVSASNNDAFADPKRIELTIGQPPPPDPPPITVKQDTIFKVLKGILFGSVALTLLGSKGK